MIKVIWGVPHLVKNNMGLTPILIKAIWGVPHIVKYNIDKCNIGDAIPMWGASHYKRSRGVISYWIMN